MGDMEDNVLKEIGNVNRKPVTSNLLLYVTDRAATAVPCYRHERGSSKNSVIYTTSSELYHKLPLLLDFITYVVKQSNVKAGILLGSLVLLTKMTEKLPPTARGMPCTCYRVFLASLILASKIFNDVCPKNSYWSKHAIHFTVSEINLMERQLLRLLVSFIIHL